MAFFTPGDVDDFAVSIFVDRSLENHLPILLALTEGGERAKTGRPQRLLHLPWRPVSLPVDI